MEFVKGKLEIIIGGYDYHKLCRIDDTEHEDILDGVPTEQAHAYLKELVRRWNSHDKLIALIWKLNPKHRHDHDYFHDDCTLCGMEKLRCEKLEAAIASARS